MLLGIVADQGTPGYFVDSVAGDDGNPGTEALPFLTIAKALEQDLSPGDTIWLAKGSSWREMLELPDGVHARSYGTGARPILDASDVALNASWVKTAGKTNVYEIAWTMDVDAHGVWEDGARFTRAADLAACDATPGTFYHALPTTHTATIYIHASDSSDVIANGKVYELRKRAHGVLAGVGSRLIGLHGRRGSSFSGAIISVEYASDCLAEDGVVHTFWVEGEAVDCEAYKCAPDPASPTYQPHFVTFPSYTAKRTVRYTRCTVTGDDAIGNSGYYIHTTGSPDVYTLAVYDDCKVLHCEGGFASSEVVTAVYHKCHVLSETTTGATGAFGGAPTHKILIGCTADSGGAAYMWFEGNGTDVFMRGCSAILRDQTNAFVGPTSSGDVQYCTFVKTGIDMAIRGVNATLAATLTYKHNILCGLGYTYGVGIGDATALTADENVYDVTNNWFLKGATLYNSLAGWQAATSQDTNSLAADPQFSGDVGDLDFSIAVGSPATALQAGVTFWTPEDDAAAWAPYA
jgi:hypothetical protein